MVCDIDYVGTGIYLFNQMQSFSDKNKSHNKNKINKVMLKRMTLPRSIISNVLVRRHICERAPNSFDSNVHCEKSGPPARF